MTPNERKRNYVFGLFTQREYAKEIRAFGLAGYLRALYERLSNERLAELQKNLRQRARYQVMSTTASAVVTALTYGALAYLVIAHKTRPDLRDAQGNNRGVWPSDLAQILDMLVRTHCGASCSMKACCMGCSSASGGDSPSIVVTSSRTAVARVRQDNTRCLPTSTVQAPH